MYTMPYNLPLQALQKGKRRIVKKVLDLFNIDKSKALCISFRFTHFHRQVLLKL